MTVPVARGLLDTSVVIGMERLPSDVLPTELAISALTVAELAAGPHATDDLAERAERQDRLARILGLFDPVPFDGRAATAYGRVFAATRSAGRKARGARAVDLMIAAIALSRDLPLVTRNPADVGHLSGMLDVVAV